MGLYYSDGSRVGGCGAQIGGIIGIIACFVLYDLGVSIGWAILIVIIATIFILIILGHHKDEKKNENDEKHF